MVLVDNLDKLHTTQMGEERIRKNLTLDVPDVIAWCKEKVFGADAIIRKGKNWYAYIDDVVITINAHSYTVITVHKSKVNVREITPADYPLLEDFIYRAIFVPPGVEEPLHEIIYNPDVFIYIDGFGSKSGDCGVVTEVGGRVVVRRGCGLSPPSAMWTMKLRNLLYPSCQDTASALSEQ